MANNFVSAWVGSGYSGKGKSPSLREKVLHQKFLYGHNPVRRDKQIWLFTPTHSAETETFKPWKRFSGCY